MNDDTHALDQLLAAVPVDPVPLTRIEHDATAVRRRRTLTIAGVAAATAVVVTGTALALTGTGLGEQDGPTVVDPATRQELAAAGGEPCPSVLPQADGSDGFGTSEPAPDSPDLADADQGWVCLYSPGTGEPGANAGGSYVTWRREGPLVVLDPAKLDALIPTLTPPELPEGGRLCTSDLGPRWLLVTSTGGDLTGIAVDAFGCRNVRITDNPAEVEPGEAAQPGTVPGVLEAPGGLVHALEKAFEASTTTASSERLEIEMGHCYVEPVSFDGKQWNVPFDQQFGGGGLQPRGWVGTGVMTRVDDDEARFDDDGGASVTFLLVDDPAVSPVEQAICY